MFMYMYAEVLLHVHAVLRLHYTVCLHLHLYMTGIWRIFLRLFSGYR